MTVRFPPSLFYTNQISDSARAASWFDHPRDLLHFINMKRNEMPRPIVGIGHSMGGAHLLVPTHFVI